MRRRLTILLLIFSIFDINAQAPRRAAGQPAVRIYGKVVDAKTKKGLDAASVQLSRMANDSATNSPRNIVAGMFTGPNGDLTLTNVPLSDGRNNRSDDDADVRAECDAPFNFISLLN